MGNYHIDIGKQLKYLRLAQKRELKDIARDTKVSENYLVAIEAGRIEEFPSTVYYNLFARSYARELGEDPDQMFVVTTAESLELERVEALGPEASAEEIKSLEVNETDNNSLAKAGIWIAAVIVIIFVVILYIFNSGDETDQLANEQLSTDSTPGIIVDTPPAATTQEGASFSAEIKPEEIAFSVPVGPKMKMRIDVTDLSWLLIMADGDTVLNRNLDSGSYRTVSAYEQFLLSAGNPNGLIIKINDTLLKPLSSTGRPVLNFEITNLNKAQYYQIVDEVKSEEPGIGGL